MLEDITNLENIWKIVKETRKSLMSKIIDPDCQAGYTLLLDNHIKDNINTVVEKLDINISSTLLRNVSNRSLQTAAEIFTYLNYCPSYSEISEIRNFLVFMKKILKSDSLHKILLALASIMKTSHNAILKSSIRIFRKTMEMFKLNNYKNIEVITKKEGFDICRNNSKVCLETVKVLGQTY